MYRNTNTYTFLLFRVQMTLFKKDILHFTLKKTNPVFYDLNGVLNKKSRDQNLFLTIYIFL